MSIESHLGTLNNIQSLMLGHETNQQHQQQQQQQIPYSLNKKKSKNNNSKKHLQKLSKLSEDESTQNGTIGLEEDDEDDDESDDADDEKEDDNEVDDDDEANLSDNSDTSDLTSIDSDLENHLFSNNDSNSNDIDDMNAIDDSDTDNLTDEEDLAELHGRSINKKLKLNSNSSNSSFVPYASHSSNTSNGSKSKRHRYFNPYSSSDDENESLHSSDSQYEFISTTLKNKLSKKKQLQQKSKKFKRSTPSDDDDTLLVAALDADNSENGFESRKFIENFEENAIVQEFFKSDAENSDIDSVSSNTNNRFTSFTNYSSKQKEFDFGNSDKFKNKEKSNSINNSTSSLISNNKEVKDNDNDNNNDSDEDEDEDEEDDNFSISFDLGLDQFMERNDPALRHLVSSAPGIYGKHESDDDSYLLPLLLSSSNSSLSDDDYFSDLDDNDVVSELDSISDISLNDDNQTGYYSSTDSDTSSNEPSDLELEKRLHNDFHDVIGSDDSTDEEENLPTPIVTKVSSRINSEVIPSSSINGSLPPILGTWVITSETPVAIIDGFATKSLSPSKNALKASDSNCSPKQDFTSPMDNSSIRSSRDKKSRKSLKRKRSRRSGISSSRGNPIRKNYFSSPKAFSDNRSLTTDLSSKKNFSISDYLLDNDEENDKEDGIPEIMLDEFIYTSELDDNEDNTNNNLVNEGYNTNTNPDDNKNNSIKEENIDDSFIENLNRMLDNNNEFNFDIDFDFNHLPSFSTKMEKTDDSKDACFALFENKDINGFYNFDNDDNANKISNNLLNDRSFDDFFNSNCKDASKDNLNNVNGPGFDTNNTDFNIINSCDNNYSSQENLNNELKFLEDGEAFQFDTTPIPTPSVIGPCLSSDQDATPTSKSAVDTAASASSIVHNSQNLGQENNETKSSVLKQENIMESSKSTPRKYSNSEWPLSGGKKIPLSAFRNKGLHNNNNNYQYWNQQSIVASSGINHYLSAPYSIHSTPLRRKFSSSSTHLRLSNCKDILFSPVRGVRQQRKMRKYNKKLKMKSLHTKQSKKHLNGSGRSLSLSTPSSMKFPNDNKGDNIGNGSLAKSNSNLGSSNDNSENVPTDDYTLTMTLSPLFRGIA